MTVTTEQNQSAVQVDDNAVAKIRSLMDKHSEADGIRIRVRGGGCSGLQYEFVMDSMRPRDVVIEKDGAKVLVDPKSMIYVRGSEFVYVKSLMQEEFQLRNPNVKGTCGCGTSFQV